MDIPLLSSKDYDKLQALNNPKVMHIVDKYIRHCRPKSVTVLTDSKDDIDYVRQLAIDKGEEARLAMEGHTIHFDGFNDQGRDLINTCVLVPKGVKLSDAIKTVDRATGIEEVMRILEGIMEGKQMFIKFYCLAPANSEFAIPALQITDSAYVVHSEDILYRQGYEEFKRLNGSGNFFHFIHSAGRLDARNNSADIANRRIYMDLEEERVFTVNNQYAGNSVGLKKLALRLAISKANKEDWLCEHMFIMGAKPQGKKRVTYFTGAFPTACGKTSTAMIPGQTIVGDDIAYIRPGKDGTARAVNVEQGIFGIIADINPVDDPLIHRALTTPRELIFSNVLVKGGVPYWLGMGKPLPDSGTNYAGSWKLGDKDSKSNNIPHAHANARYTIRINDLDNADERADDSEGVPVRGFIYGGRDSDCSIPVLQSLSWQHGVYIGAILESETTTGTTDIAGTKKHNPMSNIEFLTVPLGVYIKNHMRFGESLDKPPLVFATNYFLKDAQGIFLNAKTDKKAWLMWMEGRVHGEYGAIETPVGHIPKFEDIRGLFAGIFSKQYTREDYEAHFSIRAAKLLEKISRVEAVFKKEQDVPAVLFTHLHQEKERLMEAKEKHGDVISPFVFAEDR